MCIQFPTAVQFLRPGTHIPPVKMPRHTIFPHGKKDMLVPSSSSAKAISYNAYHYLKPSPSLGPSCLPAAQRNPRIQALHRTALHCMLNHTPSIYVCHSPETRLPHDPSSSPPLPPARFPASCATTTTTTTIARKPRSLQPWISLDMSTVHTYLPTSSL